MTKTDNLQQKNKCVKIKSYYSAKKGEEMKKSLIYNLLSNDKRIKRFKYFHLVEEKTIICFLMQIGDKRENMLKNFKRMLYLNKSITITKVNSLWKNNNITNKAKSNENREIKEYERLKVKIKKYIEKIDLTNNKGITNAFETLILYEETIRKLYIDGVEDIKNTDDITKI